MPALYVTLKNKKEVAEGTMAFYFEKPTGFEYKAGQHMTVTLLDPSETDEKGNSRLFSLASAPFEKRLMIATRMRNTAFKRVLQTLPLGAKVEVYGPSGSFLVPEDPHQPVVFLAGGIGITPFLSILKHADHEKVSRKFFLFYSNRRPEDAAFFEELSKLEQENANFTFVHTMTEPEKSSVPWQGETGYIDNAMIDKYADDLENPIYYMAGPPIMVTAMKEMLLQRGVDKEHIKHENFYGY